MGTAGFHFPWYGGGGVVEVEGSYGGAAVAERPIPFTVSLHGVEYPIELRGPDGRQLYSRRSLDRQKTGIVQSSQPDDSQFNNEGGWFRYITSWHLGTGQEVQDFGEDFSPFRFSDSRGMNPWDRFCIKPLPATEEVANATASTIHVIATGVYCYYSDGTTVYRSSDLSTWNAITATAGTVQALATDGSRVYIATTSHIYTVDDSGGTAAATFTASGGSYDNVAFVGNRLLASVANVLYEIDSAGTRTAFETHYQTAFRWTTIFAIGSRIYLGGYAGNRSEIYTATVDSTGSLVRSAEAAPFPFGELLNTAISYGGQVVLCTSLGVRLAALTGDGALTYGPLIDDAGNCLAAAAEGRFVWFGWEGFFGEGTGLGRLALDDFVASLQPAYASDVATADAIADVTGVARFGGRTVFGVSGAGVYADTPATFVTEAWVESGQVYFGTVEPKSLASLTVRTAVLDANTTLTVDVSDELGDTISSRSVTGPSVRGLDASLVQPSDDDTQVQWAKVRLTLTGDGSSSLCALSWRMRAYPVIPLVEEWIVPLIIHRHVVVNDTDGQLRSLDQLENVERLVDVCRDGRIVPYREGERTYRVRIDKYEWNPGEWDDTSDFFDGLMVVRLLSA